MNRNLQFPKIFLFEFAPDEEIVWCADDESGDGEVCEYVPASALAERDAEIERLTRALDSLLTLTKFELKDNVDRNPWARVIERCNAVKRTGL